MSYPWGHLLQWEVYPTFPPRDIVVSHWYHPQLPLCNFFGGAVIGNTDGGLCHGEIKQ